MDKDQVRRLYEQYGSWIFNRAKGLLRNEEEAWEAVQDVFLKVLEVGDKFRGESSPWTWLYRITTNHCLNLIRSRKAWHKVEDNLTRQQLALSLEAGASQASVLIDRQSFVKLLQGEDEMTQKILFAYFADELTQEEIGTLFQISRKTVYKRLKKFLDKARKA
jgi:RNA polymerase sigma-70 factor (ECF subfamily)